MSEFIPLSQIEPSVCVLPVPEALDPDTIGINLQRFKSIAALGGFMSEFALITSVSGESSSESIGIAGASGNSAFGAAAATAHKARSADSISPDPRRKGLLSNRRPTPLIIALNSTEIAAQAQASGGQVRQAETWAKPIDTALRQELSRAAWKNLLTPPTTSEFVATLTGCFVSGMAYSIEGVPLPAAYAGILAFAHASRLAEVTSGLHEWQEAHFSLLPYYHLDRALAVSARLACSKLVKAI